MHFEGGVAEGYQRGEDLRRGQQDDQSEGKGAMGAACCFNDEEGTGYRGVQTGCRFPFYQSKAPGINEGDDARSGT